MLNSALPQAFNMKGSSPIDAFPVKLISIQQSNDGEVVRVFSRYLTICVST